MDHLSDFSKIKSRVEGQYPNPIATVFRKCRISNKEDLGSRHKNIVDLFEATVKLLCIIQLQEIHKFFPNFRDALPQKEKTLEFLKRPSLGGWVGLLRILCNLKLDKQHLDWSNRITEWYRQGKGEQTMEVLNLFQSFDGIHFDSRSKTPCAEILNAFVTYRNKLIGHGANISEAELKSRLPVLEKIMSFVLESLAFLEEVRIIHIDRIEVVSQNDYLCKGSLLSGTAVEPVEFSSTVLPDKSELYIFRECEGKAEDKDVFTVSPFLLWIRNEGASAPDIYFYNDAWKTKLEYVSYQTGLYYYHRELHASFGELVKIKLKPGVEEDAHIHMSVEERHEKSERLYKRAMLLLSEEKYEDAVETLESCLEYERRSDAFLELARAQQALGESEDAIKQILQNVLDQNPEHSEAHWIISGLDKEESEDKHEMEVDEEQEIMTFFHVLLPKSLRKFTGIIWFGIIALFCLISMGIELSLGNLEYIPITVLYFIDLELGVIGHIVLRDFHIKLKLPLSQQLESLSLERFEKRFNQQTRLIFGSFILENGRMKWGKTLKEASPQERTYFLFYFPFVALICFLGVVMSGTSHTDELLMLKRIIEYAFLVTMAFPVIRYAVMLPVFIFNFSKVTLKPMLSKLSNDGIKAFGKVIVLDISVAVAMWTFGLLVALLLIEEVFYYIDFIFVILGSLLFIWLSVFMPFSLRRAAAAAKQKSISIYSSHLEDAYKGFLEDPGEGSLERYKWLIQKQSVIKKIPVWPLTLSQTIMTLVVSNLFLLLGDFLYINCRLGFFDQQLLELQTWFQNFISTII